MTVLHHHFDPNQTHPNSLSLTEKIPIRHHQHPRQTHSERNFDYLAVHKGDPDQENDGAGVVATPGGDVGAATIGAGVDESDDLWFP